MRSLVTAVALAYCTAGAFAAGAYISDGKGNTVQSGSTTSITSSVDSNSSAAITNNSTITNNSSVTSNSTNTGSTSITSSINNSQSSCTTMHNGSRCEISCLAPEVAQCVKPSYGREPSCYCQ